MMTSLAFKPKRALWLSAIAALLLWQPAWSPAPARAAENIGGVVAVVPNAFGTPPAENPITLEQGSGVVSGEVVQTGSQASVHIQFLDRTDLRMGAESLIILDELIYDPATSTGEFVFEVAVGVARFVSGDIDADKFRVKTPTAVIGIRGTDFIVDVAVDGSTRVGVIDGQVIVTPLGGPPSVILAGLTGVINSSRTQEPAQVEVGINVTEDPGLGSLEATPASMETESESEADSGSAPESERAPSFDDNLAPDPGNIVPTIRPQPMPQPAPVPHIHNF